MPRYGLVAAALPLRTLDDFGATCTPAFSDRASSAVTRPSPLEVPAMPAVGATTSANAAAETTPWNLLHKPSPGLLGWRRATGL